MIQVCLRVSEEKAVSVRDEECRKEGLSRWEDSELHPVSAQRIKPERETNGKLELTGRHGGVCLKSRDLGSTDKRLGSSRPDPAA